MTLKNNLYIELRPFTNRHNIQQISRYQNLYLKVWTSSLQILEEIPDTSNKHLTVEIVSNCKLEKVAGLEKFVRIHKPSRIITTINKKLNVDLLNLLSRLNFDNVSLDIYWSKSESLGEILSEITSDFPHIKHLSIYPLGEKLSLENSFAGFTRYHHNMWSKDASKYFAYYDLKTIRDRQYTGIGRGAVSRKEHEFYKGGKLLNIDKTYINIQDHIDRLNYYLPLEEGEFSSYPLIDKQQYLKDLKEKETMTVHQELISNLFEL